MILKKEPEISLFAFLRLIMVSNDLFDLSKPYLKPARDCLWSAKWRKELFEVKYPYYKSKWSPKRVTSSLKM
ncbi:hypothetical protein [Falsiporphyromonas endometrii]|uniref:Uncharacterized protein n=1 Tax=Falsiporphyromonas endometrii TaxID=1387297 RepID=A0ABV9K9E1_9PORP|nr:hypothetical protein [Porphyromonadaceae bacterium]